MRIEARGLVVRFGARAALAGLDCDLVSGELVGLIGPNGAGKTTLLRVLAGLQRADAGEARYDGAERGRAWPGGAGAPRRLSRPERPVALAAAASTMSSRSAACRIGGRSRRLPPPTAPRSRPRWRRPRSSSCATARSARCRAASARGRCWLARWRSKPTCCSPTSRSRRSIHCTNSGRWRCCAPRRARGRGWSPCCTT